MLQPKFWQLPDRFQRPGDEQRRFPSRSMKSIPCLIAFAGGLLLQVVWGVRSPDRSSDGVPRFLPAAASVAASPFPGGVVQEPAESPRDEPMSDNQLRLLIQRQLNELLSKLVRNDASQLSGSAGFLAKLELDAAQHRELGRIIGRSNKEAESILREAVQAAADTRDPEIREAISRDAYQKVAELAEHGLDEFQQSLLPHQIEQLDQLLASVRFQAILRICQLHDEPWSRVAGVYLGLSPEETRRFQTALEQSFASYRKQMEEARRKLARDLGEACPPAARETWTKILGEDPRELAEFLATAGALDK